MNSKKHSYIGIIGYFGYTQGKEEHSTALEANLHRDDGVQQHLHFHLVDDTRNLYADHRCYVAHGHGHPLRLERDIG